jgi:kynurenine 3-monooxygenase
MLRKELSFELERRFPDRFIPRYSMVMFHHEIPYSVAYERGRLQARILEDATSSIDTLDQVDWLTIASRVRETLAPLTDSIE